MKKLIIQKGVIKRKIDKDLYNSMISIIIVQQISTKAASTIRERLNKTYKDIRPNIIESASIEEIQSHGISFRKAQYIKNITRAFSICHKANQLVIVEGVETKEQFDLLKKNKSDFIQGYYISKPIIFSEAIKLLKSNRK